MIIVVPDTVQFVMFAVLIVFPLSALINLIGLLCSESGTSLWSVRLNMLFFDLLEKKAFLALIILANIILVLFNWKAGFASIVIWLLPIIIAMCDAVSGDSPRDG